MKKGLKIVAATISTLLFSETLGAKFVFCQTPLQTSQPSSTVDGNFNNIFQTPNQNNNINEFEIPNIYPLDNPIYTPPNPENDFGFNMSVGVNTLDASNVTLYFGLIFQPGRTNSHNLRMQRLQKETELLDTQKQIAEAELQLLRQQITEAEIKLQNLRPAPTNP